MAIRTIPTTFTLGSFRYLKKFVGDVTATVAANEVALRHSIDHAASLNDSDPWSIMGSKYQIKINGIRSKSVVEMSAKMHVVSLYSGFDGFLRSVRSEWQELAGCQWKAREDDSPFKEFLRNSPLDEAAFYHIIDKSMECGVDHYRKTRNAVVHPCEETTKKSDDYYKQYETELRELGQSYGFKEAPHCVSRIDFHDTKLLARLIIDAGKRVSCVFDPGDDAIANSIPDEFIKNSRGSIARRQNRLGCLVRTKYGLSEERANNIVAIIEAR